MQCNVLDQIIEDAVRDHTYSCIVLCANIRAVNGTKVHIFMSWFVA